MPFFGVPIRNGLPIGLGSVAGFGVQQFDPSQLFAGGTVAGAWYDPSDLTTLFTTSAGTTPVAMPGQGSAVSVGLMLDKSQGLVLGSELVTNGDFSTDSNWAKTSTTISSGALNFSGVAESFATQAGIFVASRTYELVLDIATATAGTLLILSGTGQQVPGASFTTPGVKRLFIRPNTTGTLFIYTNTSFVGAVNSISIRELPGNHAIAFNDTTARPELRARVNLLTYSEQFDNGAWTKTDATAANTSATTDPLGGTTAESLTENSATAIHRAFQEAALATANVTVTVGISLKANTRTKAVFGVGDNSDFRFYAAIDLSAGAITQSGVAVASAGASLVSASISSQGNGWYRVTLTGTVTTGQTKYFVNVAISNSDTPGGLPSYLGNGTGGIYIWGADLRPANIGANVPAYQRIADANTYDTSGFPLYLRFDGIDDSMYTPANLNLSGTDKVAVFAGVRKLTDTTGFVAETSSDAAANNGAFYKIVVPASRWEVGLRGTSYSASALSTYTSPITNVLSTQYDISASGVANEIVPRINGLTPTRTNFGSDCGTGNFGTYPLFIGSRNNSGSRLNGDFYSLLVVGSAVSAGNISATEQWVAGKTGIQI